VLRTGRLRTLVQHAGRIEAALSQEAVTSVFEAQKDLSTKRDQAAALRQHAFPAGLLMGTGSDSWSQMWEYARRFSEGSAYPDRPFPVTLDARCVLCQQDLHQDAADRLSHFEGFIVSAAEKGLRTARETYTRIFKGINDLQIVDSATLQTLSDVRIESESLADETGADL
jgi:hypothetical protein